GFQLRARQNGLQASLRGGEGGDSAADVKLQRREAGRRSQVCGLGDGDEYLVVFAAAGFHRAGDEPLSVSACDGRRERLAALDMKRAGGVDADINLIPGSR